MDDEVRRPGTADGLPPLVKWLLGLVGLVILFVILVDIVGFIGYF